MSVFLLLQTACALTLTPYCHIDSKDDPYCCISHNNECPAKFRETNHKVKGGKLGKNARGPLRLNSC